MPTNTYVALDKVTLNASTPTITFTGINQGYTDLRIVISGVSSSADNIFYRFNGVTSSSYSRTMLSGSGSAASSARASNQTLGRLTSFGFPDSTAGQHITTWDIMNYSNTTTYKTSLSRSNRANNGLDAIVNLFMDTSAITSISISTNGFSGASDWSSGTTVSLYGIAAQPVVTAAKATGGTITFAADGYTYHAFTSSGTFTPNQALTCDALVVAGGGSGGRSYGGGGGAGGLLGFTAQAFSATGYAVTVGAGGAAQTADFFRGNNGSDSQIAGLTLVKGGGGGGYDAGGGDAATGNTGGSGGGGSRTYSGGAATSGQGNRGGNISSGNAGAGGGGAGAAGGDGTTATVGGVGSSSYSQWGLATTTGQNVSGTVYYAGGGGGQSAAGGYGGGGQNVSGAPTYNSSGTANTGGGAGADSTTGSGGSGIVIIRYAS